ncbi:MAG TPA: tRNA 4-thiouridine(8) synthase ThiI [Nitrospirota bacterium]|nr:tRNA 4-thiouridine(8) synthase ThiI [Nitrospirota bacterium]
MKRTAVALISGGLDSVLAAKVIKEQGFNVTGLYFTSAFSKSYGRENETPAAAVSKAIGLDLRVIDMGQDYIDLVRNPAHGYGKHINPCIDCKIFMLSRAGAMMQELNASFVITGEVLGQRPMSQRRDTLNLIERDANLKGRVLRPLSAALLPPTKAEQDGLIQRDRLLGISGRTRTVQLRLAERYGISGYSTPAGGCLLTDKNFADKLRDLFTDQKHVNPNDVRLLTVGRHYRFDAGVKIVLGRDNEENNLLMSLASHGYHLFTPQGFPGPVALLNGTPTQEIKQTIGRLIITYSKQVPGRAYHIRYGNEVFDPGEPLPIDASKLRRVGADG